MTDEPHLRPMTRFVVVYRTMAGYPGIWCEEETREEAETVASERATRYGRPFWVAEIVSVALRGGAVVVRSEA